MEGWSAYIRNSDPLSRWYSVNVDENDRREAPHSGGSKRVRIDAQRNIETLLRTALQVFATSGVDASVREIADKAGVGVGTLYRHFPQRSDLIVAVFRQEVDACARAAVELSSKHSPVEALNLWFQRYVDFIVAKRGLAAALHSGDPAFDSLPRYFEAQLLPAVRELMEAAVASGDVRQDVEPWDLLRAVASLCTPAHDVGPDHPRRMVGLLVDGLRCGANGVVD